MNNKSLRFRLMALAVAATTLIVGATGITFYFLFQRHVEKFMSDELDRHFQQLLANTIENPDGTLSIKGRLSDPRFARPNGGLYWQVAVDGQQPIRSRSLWDETLTLAAPPTATEPNRNEAIVGPLGAEVFAIERLITVPLESGKEKQVLYVVAEDRSRASNAISSFATAITWGLGTAYLALLAGSAIMIALGLKPLGRLQKAIEAVRTGNHPRLTVDVPSEIAPLANEVNGLIEAREKQLERARQRASNLAHGLKTPLSVMHSVADKLRILKMPEEAADIRETAQQMNDLVERELAKSRMADGKTSHRANLRQVATRVTETLKRAPNGDSLDWQMDVSTGITLAIDQTDLTEMLGCILDNARKHAQSLVRISYQDQTLIVEDDGPGVDDDKLKSILQRGVRLDSTKPGSGLGLAIVNDLAEVYSFELEVRRSHLGGLLVSAAIPKLA